MTLRTNRREDGFTAAVQEFGYQGVRRGDLVIHSMDGFAGAIGVSDSDGKASPVVHCYTPQPGIDARYYAYLLRDLALRGFIIALAKGIRERSTAFDAETFRALVLPVPPSRQQGAIADFLDTETARIDALITKKRRMITLLRMRLTSAICESLPGWNRVPLKRVVDYREGPGIMAVDFRDHGVPLIRIAGVTSREVSLKGCNYLDPGTVTSRWRHFALRKGDYLISASASMGVVARVGDSAEGAIPYTGLIRFRSTRSDMEMEFVRFFLQSRDFMSQIDRMKTGVGIEHFGPTHLDQVTLPVPPLDEQSRISDHLKAIERRVDRCVSALVRQIELLREHRQALITAAVTGEMEVPGVAA